MLETPTQIIFPSKVLVRKAIQQYAEGLMRKSAKAIKNLKFTGDTIEFRNEHEGKPIGEVTNFVLKGFRWLGDIIFLKKLMTPEQIIEVRTLKKRDVSIGFSFIPQSNDDANILWDQTEIIVDHLAWVTEGRCSYPSCGLDSTEEVRKIDNDVIRLPECDDIIKANDSAHKTALDVKDKELEALTKAYDTVVKAHDINEALLIKYQLAEKNALIKHIMDRSSLTKEKLEKDSLEDLQGTLEILKASKGADAYPSGEEKAIENAPYKYDEKGPNDLTAMLASQEKAKGESK